jgi:phenylpropionate dioxygenase-like ring-hydroxylating dioxygenase large terminal subunit
VNLFPNNRKTVKLTPLECACVRSLPTAIRQGLLFVYAGNPENAPLTTIPIIEPMQEDADAWICLDTFRESTPSCRHFNGKYY